MLCRALRELSLCGEITKLPPHAKSQSYRQWPCVSSCCGHSCGSLQPPPKQAPEFSTQTKTTAAAATTRRRPHNTRLLKLTTVIFVCIVVVVMIVVVPASFVERVLPVLHGVVRVRQIPNWCVRVCARLRARKREKESSTCGGRAGGSTARRRAQVLLVPAPRVCGEGCVCVCVCVCVCGGDSFRP